MDALKFIEERNRMCKSFAPDCEGCRIDEVKPVIDECVSWVIDNAEKAIDIVEQWSRKHPRKTRQDVLLAHYPDAALDYGVLRVCPRNVCKSAELNCNNATCYHCKGAFWLQEVE